MSLIMPSEIIYVDCIRRQCHNFAMLLQFNAICRGVHSLLYCTTHSYNIFYLGCPSVFITSNDLQEYFDDKRRERTPAIFITAGWNKSGRNLIHKCLIYKFNGIHEAFLVAHIFAQEKRYNSSHCSMPNALKRLLLPW